MGLLDYLQSDPSKQEALRAGLLNMGVSMMANRANSLGESLGAGAGAGISAYEKQFEDHKKKIAQQQAMAAAMTPASAAVPESYKVGGASYKTMPEAQAAASPYMASLPKLGAGGPLMPNTMNASADLAPFRFNQAPRSDMASIPTAVPVNNGNPSASQGPLLDNRMDVPMDAQPIETVPGQAAQAGGFDIGKYFQGILTAGPDHPSFGEAVKYYASKVPLAKAQWKLGERYNDKTGMPEKFMYNPEDPTQMQAIGGAQADTVTADNLGGVTSYRFAHSATPIGSAAHTATPDAIMSNGTSLRGQNLSAATARRGQDLSHADSVASRANSDATSLFTPAAIENAAARYNVDGTLPPMGMGKNGSLGRSAILNKAAEMAGLDGVSPSDQRVNQLGNKATAAGLNQLVKQQTMVSAFEKNARLNGAMALQLSDKVDRTGSPLLNTWLQAGQRNVTGNPELNQFHAANETFVNEYAKIMSGSMGNTAVSDSARAHAHSLLSTVHNKASYAAVMSTLNQEMDNRMTGFDQEVQATRDKMRGGKPKDKVVDFGDLK